MAQRQQRARDRDAAGSKAHLRAGAHRLPARRRRRPTPGPGAAIGGAQPLPGPLTSLLSSVVCCQAALLLQMVRAAPRRPSTPRAAVLSMAISRASPVKVGLDPQAPPRGLADSPVTAAPLAGTERQSPQALRGQQPMPARGARGRAQHGQPA